MMAVLLSLAASAKSVVFTLSNGTKVYYLLGGETNPVMKFMEGKVVVNADEYEIAGIKSFVISDTDDPNGIEQTFAEKEVSFKANQFVVKTDAKNVRVFGMSGAPVKASVANADGWVTVDLSELSPGTYIINVGESSFKVMKK